MLEWLKRRAGAERKSAVPLWALAGLGRPHWPSSDPQAYAREGYAANAVAYRCVRLVAECAGATQFRVTPAEHPLALLLAKPNPEQTWLELIEAFFGHLQVSGNAYLEAAGFELESPRELYVLRPDRMRVLPGARGWPIGWEHRVGAETVRFERDALTGRAPILHLKLFNPLDDWYGQAPLAAAAHAVDIHNAGGAWNKALIDNAARPSGALVFSGADRLSEEQFVRLKAELEGAHAGPGNAGRPLLLEGGLDWRPMSLSPQDMDFIEARHAAAREIALAFGVPPMLLGIPGDNTYANYKEANLAFLRQTVLPLAQKTAAALEAWLGEAWPEAGPARVALDLDAAPGLAAERDALWARLEAADFLDRSEKRRLAGLEEEQR
jgi:HK97 family phage portal protein